MTETQTPPRPPVTIGQAVGLAEAALTRLPTGVLAETGTSRETYLAFSAARPPWTPTSATWPRAPLWPS